MLDEFRLQLQGRRRFRTQTKAQTRTLTKALHRLTSSMVGSPFTRGNSTANRNHSRGHAARRPQRKRSPVTNRRASGGAVPSPCARHRHAHGHSRRRPVAPNTRRAAPNRRLAVDRSGRHRHPVPHMHPGVHIGIGRLRAVVAQESARNNHAHWLEPKPTRVRRRPQRLPAARLRTS